MQIWVWMDYIPICCLRGRAGLASSAKQKKGRSLRLRPKSASSRQLHKGSLMQESHSKGKSSAQVIRLRPELPEVLAPLMESNRWVLWKYQKRNGETTKPPYSEENEFASTRDEKTWLSYREAMRTFKEGWAQGIGFNIGEGIGAIDLDHCFDGEIVVDWAREIIDQTKSYVEVTPSGKGLRIIGFTRGENVHTNRKRGEGKLELYRGECGRYITVTGRPFRDCVGLINIDELIDKLASNKDSDSTPSGLFFRSCAKLFDRGKSDEWINQEIGRHPHRWKDSAAERYISAGRLAGEIARCRERWESNNPEKAEHFVKTKDKAKGAIEFKSAELIEPRDLSWEWYPYIAQEEMFWIMSRGGVGKGLMCADLAARMTTGNKWPCSQVRATKGNVLWYESEDNLDTTIVPRLIAAGADRSRVFLFDRDPASFFKLTRKQIEERDIGMIVLSPLLSYLDIENFRDEIQVRDALEKMSSLIRGLSCTIVGLLHPNKKDGLEAIERILGSVAFGNFVRSLVILRDEAGVARMVHAKYNLSVKGDDLSFTKYNTEPKKHATGQYIAVTWAKTKENADESSLLDRMTKAEKAVTATGWIENFLEDGQWHTCEEIFKAGAEAVPPHNEQSLRQAKKRNDDIEFERRGFGGKLSWRLKKRRSRQ